MTPTRRAGDIQQQLEVDASTRRTNQKCRSCQAWVTFYRLTSGKWMPFNGDPPLEIQESFLDGEAKAFISTAASHFVTCPDADKWRRDR